MSLSIVKKTLTQLDKPEIICLIADMYQNISEAKTYLDLYAGSDTKPLIKKYKAKIAKYIYPSGRALVFRKPKARKLIDEAAKLNKPEINIELSIYYVECCLDVIHQFGGEDESYLMAIAAMYHGALHEMTATGLKPQYEKRLNTIASHAADFGLDLPYF